MRTLLTIATILSLAATGATSASAQAGARDSAAALRAQARVSMKAARRIALKRVPKGRIVSSELVREDGKLIYSFDIETRGKLGFDEVHVSAITGRIVGPVVHANPTDMLNGTTQGAKAPKNSPTGIRKP